MKKNKVMVLMSTYNGQQYLEEQICSILNQEGVDVFLRIRDDGSKDNTINIIRKYMKAHSNIDLVEGKNIGFAQSFIELVYSTNECTDIDYFAFSDQDDVWLNDKLLSAVTLLSKQKPDCPNLYFSTARAVDRDLNYLFDYGKYENYTFTKPSSLVKCYMLGCTMVFPYSTVKFLSDHRPVYKLQMHDLWINQTCVFFGNIVYDKTPHILYRQHGRNIAGVSNSLKNRVIRTINSFSTYEKRHFRELNAKCFLDTYNNLLSPQEKEWVSTVAFYRKSVRNRLKFLFSRDICMGVFDSDILLKARILFGFA